MFGYSDASDKIMVDLLVRSLLSKYSVNSKGNYELQPDAMRLILGEVARLNLKVVELETIIVKDHKEKTNGS